MTQHNNNHQSHRKPTGLTLIEIIFSIAILGTVVTLAYASGLLAWKQARAANQRTQAQYILQESIENIRAYRDTAGFDWVNFVQTPNLGSGFVVKLCIPADVPACTWKTITSVPDLQYAAGQTISQSDPTEYKVTITPVDGWLYDVPSNTTSQTTFSNSVATSAANTNAISVVAKVEYTDANGILSNAQLSTIITRTN